MFTSVYKIFDNHANASKCKKGWRQKTQEKVNTVPLSH